MTSKTLNRNLLTTAEVAAVLRISRSSLYKRISAKTDIPHNFKIGRRRYFKAEDLVNWIEEQSNHNLNSERYDVQ